MNSYRTPINYERWDFIPPFKAIWDQGKRGDLISILSNTKEHHTAVMFSGPDNIFYSFPDEWVRWGDLYTAVHWEGGLPVSWSNIIWHSELLACHCRGRSFFSLTCVGRVAVPFMSLSVMRSGSYRALTFLTQEMWLLSHWSHRHT